MPLRTNPTQHQKLIVKYPPDYDGELHIHTTTEYDDLGSVVHIALSVRTLPGESIQDTIKRVGQDMQRAR